jgi:hypothetical protein
MSHWRSCAIVITRSPRRPFIPFRPVSFVQVAQDAIFVVLSINAYDHLLRFAPIVTEPEITGFTIYIRLRRDE